MPTSAWTVRSLDLGRTLVERHIGGVLLQLVIYDGGGFTASHTIVRVAGLIAAIRVAPSA